MQELRRGWCEFGGAGTRGMGSVAIAILGVGLASCGVEKRKFESADPVALIVSANELAVLEGEQTTFTVALSERPSDPVQVTLRSSAETKLEGAPTELSFQPDTFDVAQTVTVTGKVDRDAVNEAVSIAVESVGLESVTIAVAVIECPTLAAQDFWVLFNPNLSVSGRREIYVAGAAGTLVTIADAPAAEIPASGILTVDTGLGRVPTPDVVESGKAFQISSSAPVQVFANNFSSTTVDAFTAVPVQLLGTEYRAIGYPNSIGQPSQIAVYATADNTTVTIGNGVPITLNRGQSFLRSGTSDVTGLRVIADKPVAVNSGDACLNTGAGACDHVEEMLFPVASWASDFYVPVIPQGQNFRVVAASDGTVVTVDGAEVGTLKAGEFYAGSGGGKRVQTSLPSQVYIIALGENNVEGNGDPAFILLPGVQNAVDSTTFSALAADNENTLVVSMPTAAIPSLLLDGAAVAAQWAEYASGGHSYVQIPIAAGSHTLTANQAFIPVVWGEKAYESYGYVAGYGYPKATCQLP
jgi:IgGFc binding protein